VTEQRLSRGPSTGTVTAFDDARGLGEITAADGTLHPFHCVSIADGTRTIEVGNIVTFGVLAKLGRYEAGDIRRT
jgi:cold shock CspA family protein